MKKFIFFARVYTWLLVVFPLAIAAQNLDIYPNYVVIGAFEHKKNAVFFTDDANQHNFPARFEMNPNRNLYYVYVLTTDDREYAFAEALKLRKDTKYFDTWVYSGLLGNASLPNAKSQDFDINPTTGEQILSLQPDKGGKDDLDLTNKLRNSGANVSDSANNEQASTSSEISDKEGTQQTRRGRSKKANQTGVFASARDSGTPALEAKGQKQVGSNVDANDGNKNLASTSSELSEKEGAQQTRTRGPTKVNETEVSGSTRDSQNHALQTIGGKQDASHINSDKTDSPDQSGRANKSGSAINENKKQVTIIRADGTSVVARTANGSSDDNNSRTGLAADPSDQTRNPNTSAENTKDAYVSDDPAGKSGTQKNDVANADGLPLNADKKDNPGVTGPPPIKVSTQPLSAEEVVGKNFYFYLFRADNHDMIAGEVDAIDFEKARRMATYDANTQVKVIMPSGKSKQISFVCQVFGYRKLQKEFDPASPAEDMYLDDKGNVVVPFELIRMQKGDIAIMYNVFFFKDAAVMRPESRYEVNNLLELLQENPSYKIKIHGHTNGNAPGKIIYMDKPGNFYSLSNTRQGGGSAKKLSEERALVIREYLISSGVLPDRMQVEAWGGKKPIHDKNSARAHENVRVEIEILSD